MENLTSKQEAYSFLQALYDVTNADPTRLIEVTWLFEHTDDIGLTCAPAILAYLQENKLIVSYYDSAIDDYVPFRVKITAAGVDAVEEYRVQARKTVPGFRQASVVHKVPLKQPEDFEASWDDLFCPRHLGPLPADYNLFTHKTVNAARANNNKRR